MIEKIVKIKKELQVFLGKSRTYIMELLRDMKISGNENVIFNPSLKLYGVFNFEEFINNIKDYKRCEEKEFTKGAINTILTSPLMESITGNQLEQILYRKQ